MLNVVYKPPPPILSEVEKLVKVVKPRKARVKKQGGSSATGTPVGVGYLFSPGVGFVACEEGEGVQDSRPGSGGCGC